VGVLWQWEDEIALPVADDGGHYLRPRACHNSQRARCGLRDPARERALCPRTGVLLV